MTPTDHLVKRESMMHVIKRDGTREPVQFDKIVTRIDNLSADLDVDPVLVAQKVVGGVIDGIHTSSIDELAAETAAYMAPIHPDYGILAGRISVSNLQKNTLESFSETMKLLRSKNAVLFAEDDFMKVIETHGEVLDGMIDYSRDFAFDHFGFETLARSYLLKIDGTKVVERPQHMWMRVALGIHGWDLEAVKETYDMLSLRVATHATPTLFNAGFMLSQKSSCYLMQMRGDSVDGIYDTLKQCALISKTAGGIGLAVHNVRGKGAPIMGTNGTSNGLVPMLRVFDSTARYIDQCFAPETLVPTTQGLKKIEDVVIGDVVMTGTGKTERVSKVFRTSENKELLGITVRHSIEPVWVTEAHPMWVLRQRKDATHLLHVDKKCAEEMTEFVPAGEIKVGDYIGVSIPSYVNDVPEYTNDDCRFYGMMVGGGHVTRDDREAHTETADVEFCANYLMENGCRYTVGEKTGTHTRYAFSPQVSGMFKFGRNMLYDGNDEKIIHPSMLHLPIENALQIVRGVVETGGVNGEEEEEGPPEIVLETTSKNVVESVAYILLRAGVLTSGATVGHGAYRLRIPKVQVVCDSFGLETTRYAFFDQLRYENCMFTRVESIEKKERDGGSTYDLETEGPEHTYLTRLGIAHNGGGKRKGSFAVYLEPWHADIEDFLQLKRLQGKEESKARDLFYGLWIPDLFMKRVMDDGAWTLFSPDSAPGLHLVWGEEFEALYEKYEKEGRGAKTMRAADLWQMIKTTHTETGTPYMCFKDSSNRRSNHQHLGTIACSNLCTEILEYTSKDEVAVCNLASISLPAFLRPDGSYDFEGLQRTARILTRNLNKIIDTNYYPVPEARNSNLRHRPIGVGVQGLADVFMAKGWAFDAPEARAMNRLIFEHIYYGCLDASCALAERDGAYASYEGSPFSKGILQMDMGWPEGGRPQLDWTGLRARIAKHGVRNSLLTTVMPTASTSQILGNTECIEPIGSNLYARKTLAGDFFVVNKWLVRDLKNLGVWGKSMQDAIVANRGSVQGIPGIPEHLQRVYRTVYEIPQKSILEMAADRAPFIDQSQSLNIHMQDASYQKYTSLFFYAWKLGLKTTYYLRCALAANPIQFSLENKKAEVPSSSPSLSSSDCLNCSA